MCLSGWLHDCSALEVGEEARLSREEQGYGLPVGFRNTWLIEGSMRLGQRGRTWKINHLGINGKVTYIILPSNAAF